jgi:hypothetical protein
MRHPSKESHNMIPKIYTHKTLAVIQTSVRYSSYSHSDQTRGYNIINPESNQATRLFSL